MESRAQAVTVERGGTKAIDLFIDPVLLMPGRLLLLLPLLLLRGIATSVCDDTGVTGHANVRKHSSVALCIPAGSGVLPFPILTRSRIMTLTETGGRWPRL